MRKRNSDQAVILIEALLVIPIIIIIALAGVEVTRSLRTMKFAITLGQGVAAAAYRECSPLLSQTQTVSKAQDCIDKLRQEVNGLAVNIAPGAEVYLTVYGEDQNGFTSGRQAKPCDGGGPACKFEPKFTAAFNAGNFGVGPGSIQEQKFFAIGEAFVPYKPIFQMVAGVLGFSYKPTTTGAGGTQVGGFYDITVL